MATGIGITLPITRGTGGYFAQSFDIITAIKSNVINLIMTRKGERPMEPTFGCDIQNFVFEQMGDTFNSAVDNAVRSSMTTWMPFLNVISVDVATDNDHNLTTVIVNFSLKSNVNVTDTITVVF